MLIRNVSLLTLLALALATAARPAAAASLVLPAPKESIAIIVVDGAALQKKPELKPVVELLKKMAPYLTVDPLSVTGLQVAICPRSKEDDAQKGPREPVLPFIVMQFRDPASAQQLVDSCEGLVEKEHAGKKYLSSPSPRYPSIYHIDGRTLVLSFDRLIESFIDDSTPPAEIRQALARASMQGEIRGVFLPASQKDALERALSQPGLIPPPIAGLGKLPKHVGLASARFDFSSREFFRMELDTQGEDASQEVQQRVDSALAFTRDLIDEALLPAIDRLDIPADIKKQAKPFSDASLGKIKVTAERQRVVVSLPATAETIELASTLLPVASAELSRAFERQMQTLEVYRMRTIANDLTGYLRKHHRFPGEIGDAAGRPIMSWRCELLRDQEEYQFREGELDLTLPWNAEANRAALAKVRYPFVNSETAKVQGLGATNVVRFTGPGTLSDGGKPVRETDVKDGLAKTIFCVVASPAKRIPWAQPGDLPLNPKNPIAALGEISGDNFLALFCDGSLRRIPKSIKAETLQALITPAGGEPVDETKFESVFQPVPREPLDP